MPRIKTRYVRHLLATTAVVALIYGAEPAVAQGFNWTGPYVGVNFGYMQANVKGSGINNLGDGAGGLCNSPFAAKSSSSGAIGGIQGGYNYQFSGTHFVVGLEGDIDLASNKGSSVGGGFCGCGFNQSKVSALGTLRARAGYAMDRVLFFGTAGLAVGDVQNSSTINVHDGNFGLVTTKGWQAGWTAGGGIEYALTDHCLIKLETLYVDLGTKKGANTANDCTCTASFHTTAFVTRAGVAWKF